jgi:hypothetical protein
LHEDDLQRACAAALGKLIGLLPETSTVMMVVAAWAYGKSQSPLSYDDTAARPGHLGTTDC